MKILLLGSYQRSFYLLRGGLIKSLVRDGHTVVCISPFISLGATGRIQALGATWREVKIDRAGVNPLRDLRTIASLISVFREERADFLLCYTAKPVIYGLVAGIFAGIPHRHALISGLGYMQRATRPGIGNCLFRSVLRRVMALAGTVCFHNREDMVELANANIVGLDRAYLVGGSGVNLESFAPVVRNDDGEKALCFVMVSRLVRSKGVFEFIEAAREVRRLKPRTRFLLIGELDANPASLTQNEVQKIADEGVVECLGFQDDIQLFLSLADVFVLPTYYQEGLPHTVLQAMAMGVPVLSTSTRGVDAAVRHGIDGLLVEPRSSSAIVLAMMRFIDEPIFRRNCGRSARRRAELEFDELTIARSMIRKMGVISAEEIAIPRKILVVATVSVTVRAFLLPHLQMLRQEGFRVHSAASGASLDPLVANESSCAVSLLLSRNPLSPYNVLGFMQLCAMLRSFQYSDLWVHTPIAAWIARAAAKAVGFSGRFTYTAHGFHFYNGGGALANATFKVLETGMILKGAQLVTINQEDFQFARSSSAWSPEGVFYIPGIGVDLKKYSRASISPDVIDAARVEIGIPRGALYFLSIGELVRNKRHMDALEAFFRASLGDEVHFVFAGVGPEAERLRLRAKQFEVQDRVHLVGFRRDVDVLLAGADRFVFVTEREGLPRSLMEAIAMEVPCVATDVRGNRDLLNGTGYELVRVGHIAGIARLMRESVGSRGDFGHRMRMARLRLNAYDIGNVLKLYRPVFGLNAAGSDS